MAELTKSQTRALMQDIATVARRHGVDEEVLKGIVSEHGLPAPPPPKFAKGDRVAWSHKLAGLHGAGSVLNPDALPVDVHTPEPADGTAGEAKSTAHPTPIGTIVAPANEQFTTWVVAFDKDHLGHPGVIGAAGTHADDNKLTLTSDELVKVEED